MKRGITTILTAVLFLFLGTNSISAASARNYTVYSVFIYNFIKYLEWPVSNEKITVAVWNNRSATEALEVMAKAKSTPAREIIVKNITDEKAFSESQLLFVPANSTSAFLKNVEKLKSTPVVAVTEEADLTERGAGISFKTVSEKIRFQMNNDVLKSSGVKVSGTLDALALK
jgi:hypothetical protein